jgi:DNA-directed RNA polymerase subunit N (RpoN/RPB10)
MISCSQAVSQLWDYVEGAVEGAQREALEEHLGVCRRCCGEVEFTEELRSFLADHGDADLPPGVKSRLTSFLNEM